MAELGPSPLVSGDELPVAEAQARIAGRLQPVAGIERVAVAAAVGRVLAADGGAQSDLWLQIAADTLERPVTRIAGHPGSCLGAAFVAGMGVGALKNWAEIGRYVAPGRVFTPDPVASRVLSRKYALWRESYERLRTLFPELGHIG